MTKLNKDISELESILTKLVTEFEYGYAFIKNSRELLEQLTKYKENNSNDKLKVALYSVCNDVHVERCKIHEDEYLMDNKCQICENTKHSECPTEMHPN